MAKDKIQDLRHHLFAQLERLGDDELMKDQSQRFIELDRAKAMCDISQTIINSAKVEIDYLKAIANSGTNVVKPNFLGLDNK